MPDPATGTSFGTIQDLVKEAEEKLAQAHYLSKYFKGPDPLGRPVAESAATELGEILITVKTWVVRHG